MNAVDEVNTGFGYKIHVDGQNSLTKKLVISQGQHISYQMHKHRTEIRTFTESVGELILDDVVKEV